MARAGFLQTFAPLLAAVLLISTVTLPCPRKHGGGEDRGGRGGGRQLLSQQGAGRRHLAASGCSTSYQLGGTTQTFATCKALSGGVNFAWSLLADKTTLRAVFSASSGGWVGLGFSSRGKMVGSSAVAGFPTSSGVYVNSYYLGGEKPNQCLPPGQQSVSNMAAQYSNGVLSISFTQTFSSAQSSSVYLIWALGASGNSGTGQLTEHTNYWSGSVMLTDGLETATSSTPVARSASTPSATSSSATSKTTPSPTASLQGGTTTSTPASTPATVVLTPGGSTSAPATATSAATSSSNTTCGAAISFGGTAVPCQQCVTLDGGITLGWNISTDMTTLQVAMSASHNGWLGFALSADRSMVGSTAVIGFPASGTSASISPYYLGGEKSADCPKTSTNAMSNLAAEYRSGVTTLLFTLELDASTATSAGVIWALGGQGDTSSGLVPEHTDYWSGTIDFQSAQTSDVSTSSSKKLLRNAHGIMEAVAFLLLLPLGVFSARYFRHHDPGWFTAHKWFMSLGYMTAVIGFFVAGYLWRRATQAHNTHAIVGLLVIVMATLQVFAFAFRPLKTHKLRYLWNFYHHWTGRTAMILALVNIYTGIDLLDSPLSVIHVIFWVIIAIIIVLVVFLEIRKCCRKGDTTMPSAVVGVAPSAPQAEVPLWTGQGNGSKTFQEQDVTISYHR